MEAVAYVLWWIGALILASYFFYVAAEWFFGPLADFISPPSQEEISRREAERIAKQATKDYKNRQRLRARAWKW